MMALQQILLQMSRMFVVVGRKGLSFPDDDRLLVDELITSRDPPPWWGTDRLLL